MKKRGIFFTTDALIALVIIFLTIIIIFPAIRSAKHQEEMKNDVMGALSSLKAGEFDDDYMKNLIDQSIINNTNQSILEQIGELYVKDIDSAKDLASYILEKYNTSKNIGIFACDPEVIGGNCYLLASKNNTPIETAGNVYIDRQYLAGVIKNPEGIIKGYSSRAFLSKTSLSKYYYFGGYVGDGNITVNLEYYGTAKDFMIELATNNKYSLYLNGNYLGDYGTSSQEFRPYNYSLNGFINYLVPGTNIIQIKSNGTLYIAGGYIRIIYYNSTGTTIESNKKYFPGIDGLINIYDSIYSPKNITAMNISIHYNSSFMLFMKIGNVTIFRDNTSVEKTLTITDTQIKSLINYNDISKKTVPIRLGLENVSYVIVNEKKLDVFSVTPLPSSMNSVKDAYNNTKVDVPRYANRVLMNVLLANPSTQIGLVGVTDKGEFYPNYTHNLTRNYTQLNATLMNWSLRAGVCLCCAVNYSVNSLISQSNSSDLKTIVLMADNNPTADCGGGAADIDTINIACNASKYYGIRFDTISVGTGAQVMLQKIANCSNGTYHVANYTYLFEIYRNISETLIRLIQKEQTVYSTVDAYTKLYPDSYIEIAYKKDPPTYGLVITEEKIFDNNYSGTFSIPENASIVETVITSYSGPRWTDKVSINGNNVYNISIYSTDYTKIGDSYTINVPDEKVNQTSLNIINVTTANDMINSTEGSEYNKIIYTFSKNMSSFSKCSSASDSICFHANGCNWTVEYNDGTTYNFLAPENYTGTEQCFYTSGLKSYDNNDAIQSSVYNMLSQLDFNNDNVLDTKLTDENVKISSSEISNIPFVWSTEIQIREWY